MKPKRAGKCIYGKEIHSMDSFSQSSLSYPSAGPTDTSQPDLKIALQSALASGLCLGLPAGLFFWVMIIQRSAPSTAGNALLNFLRANLVPPMPLEILGALGWGFCLSRISGYRPWWWLSVATIAGVWLGNFPFYSGWLDSCVQGDALHNLSLHSRFVLILCLTVLCVTMSTGLLLGLTLKNRKASLILAGSTGLASVSAALVTLMILEGLGIRVGTGNIAMPKATAAATMAAALVGGAILGIVFSRYVRNRGS
jgi:hypothetical protein